MAPFAARHALRVLAILAIALFAIPAVASAATRPPKAPKHGWEYRGQPGDVLVMVSGKSLEYMGFSFPCGDVRGLTGLNDFPLKRTTRGYRVDAHAHGSITYTDEFSENAKVDFVARWSLDAKTVRGYVRVVSPRCGDTGRIKWKGSRYAK